MRTIKVWHVALAAGLLAVPTAVPSAAAAGDSKVLGTDAENDAPPGADLVALHAAQKGRDLHVRIVLSLIPGLGSYPEAGIQWSFSSRGRTFAVEAHQEAPGEYGYTLYEVIAGAYKVISPVEGVMGDNGFDITVPLSSIGASKGTVIKGAPLDSALGDVEMHQHANAASRVLDDFQTTKTFKVR